MLHHVFGVPLLEVAATLDTRAGATEHFSTLVALVNPDVVLRVRAAPFSRSP